MELRAGYKNTGIGMIPDDWKVEKIDDVLKVSTGSKNTQDKLKDGKYPFFVRSQTIERINSFAYDCEAVLTAGDGVGTGKIFHYVNGKFELHQRVYIMNNFRVCFGFIVY
jgi:type I restriction enzyme S subunit